MSEELKQCPQCASPYAYMMSETVYVCPECAHEWNPAELQESQGLLVKDSNGNILHDGDAVIIIKNLPVKG
ncbi:MAG TPA: alkylphosphonate utilization protein, partial [Bacteroidales bacterium]|nr:alkylphosphonate utilization protein [Bacteroidales bacterium]